MLFTRDLPSPSEGSKIKRESCLNIECIEKDILNYNAHFRQKVKSLHLSHKHMKLRAEVNDQVDYKLTLNTGNSHTCQPQKPTGFIFSR